MKKTRYCFVALLLLGVLFGWLGVPAQASEPSLDQFSEMVDEYLHGPEEGAEGREYRFCALFFENPVEFVRALAGESREVQDAVIERLPRGMFYDIHPDGYAQFPPTVFAIRLAEDDPADMQYILKGFEDRILQYWGISNPKTGDSLGIALAVMALCVVCAAVLISRKRYI